MECIASRPSRCSLPPGPSSTLPSGRGYLGESSVMILALGYPLLLRSCVPLADTFPPRTARQEKHVRSHEAWPSVTHASVYGPLAVDVVAVMDVTPFL